MKETAAQRALGIFEIVDLIASHIPVQIDFSIVGSAEAIRLWNDAGFIARGVNSLWKRAFDQRMVYSATDGSVWTCLDRLPLPFLHIMAISPELPPSLKRIKAVGLCHYQLDAVCSAPLSVIRNLRSLSIDGGALVAFSSKFRARPLLRLTRLRELQVDLADHRVTKNFNADEEEDVIAFLATMTSLTSLRLNLRGIWFHQYRRHVIPAQQLRFITSIRGTAVQCLEVFYDLGNWVPHRVDPDIPLASITENFKNISTLSLAFDHCKSLKDAVPATVQELKVTCDSAGMQDILALISDHEQLPQLSAVPNLDYIVDRYNLERLSVVITVEMVHRAIAGLKRRGGVLGFETAGARLYRLVREREQDK